jgi:His/Glu/Gln/Arg/opine family amino acid ABC transporter permease subunit
MEHAAMIWLKYAPLIFQGACMTLGTWLLAGILSILIGTGMGILSCNRLAPIKQRRIIRFYTFIAKGIPAYVQILIAYFVLPALLGINVSGIIAATLALAFCSSGYVTEIVRSGINTISFGQWDACFVLGYSQKSTLARIILPQTFKNILPTLLGELEQLLKSTSLLATIGITELTRTGMNIISRELNPIPIYLMIACIYLLFAATVQLITIYAEKRTNYDCH